MLSDYDMTTFTKIKLNCGCVFARKESDKEDKIVWIYVNPACYIDVHNITNPP